MKKIFVFKPYHKEWSYCGGGRVIIAETFEEAASFFPNDNMAISESEAEKLIEKSGHSWDTWELVASYPTNDQPSQIVLDDYNWG